MGTENGGLHKFNREKENFQHLFYYGEPSTLRDATVTAIHEDAIGNLWVGTSNHLYRISEEASLMEISPSNRTDFTEYFRVIQSDQQGRIWLGTNNGLYVYDLPENKIQTIDLGQDMSRNQEIWTIFRDTDNALWIGTYANGLFMINSSSLVSKHITLDRGNERSQTVRAVAKDRNGKYWIGTRGGLYAYDKINGTTAYYCHDEREPRSLVNNSIQCIFPDLKGDIWIGRRRRSIRDFARLRWVPGKFEINRLSAD
jgi:ligand-binding sensor domain-containing protein